MGKSKATRGPKPTATSELRPMALSLISPHLVLVFILITAGGFLATAEKGEGCSGKVVGGRGGGGSCRSTSQ